MLHQLRDAALNRPHDGHHPRSHRLKQGYRQAFKVGHQQDRLTALQQRLHLLGGNTAMKMDAIGHAGLVHELLASGARSAVTDEVGFYLARDPAGVDEGVHHLLDALLALHQAAAVHHAERLVREAGLGHWRRDAAGDHLRVSGGQALAQLLGQELGDADAAAAVGFRGEGFGDAPVIGVVGMHGEDPGQALPAGVGGGEVVRVQALGQEQVGLHLVEELEGPAIGGVFRLLCIKRVI